MTSTEPSLLAILATRLAKSPEDVATEGLAHVLNGSPISRAVVQRLAEDWATHAIPAVVTFRAQVVGSDETRTDLEGHDQDGHPVIIFENKFWAGLTAAQPHAYLTRLGERGGILCFVAPTSRLGLLWDEVRARTEIASGPVQQVRNDPELKVASIPGQRTVVLTSWAWLLGRIREALEASGDSTLVMDVRQLLGLAERMDREGFLPVTAADITGPTARHVMQYCGVVDDAVARLLKYPSVSKQGLKATAGPGWYGHYIWLHGFGAQLSFNAPMWARYGRSPIWLRVSSREFKYSADVERRLDARFGRQAMLHYSDGSAQGSWTACALAEGQEREAVVDGVVEHVLAAGVSLGGGPEQ